MTREEKVTLLKQKVLKEIDERIPKLLQAIHDTPTDFSFEKRENENYETNFLIFNSAVNQYYTLMRLREYVTLPIAFMEQKLLDHEYVLMESYIDIFLSERFCFASNFLTSISMDNDFQNEGGNEWQKEFNSYRLNLSIGPVMESLDPKFFMHCMVTAIDMILYEESKEKQSKN